MLIANNRLAKKPTLDPLTHTARKMRFILAVFSFAAVIPFVLSQNAFADLNLFQKKAAQNESSKEGDQPSNAVPQSEAASTESPIGVPLVNASEQDNSKGSVSILANQSASPAAQMTSSKGIPKIIVVDVQGVLMSSSVGKDIKKQFDDKQAAFMKEIEVEEGELKKTEQDLLRQRTVLSQDVFAKKKAEFDERMVALNTKFQKNRQILEEAFNLARTDVESKLLDVIKEVKIEQSANLVLPAQQVIMGDDQMDVTSEVLSRFNKKVPGYKVNF